MSDDKLKKYRSKRDFSKTAEPAGTIGKAKQGHSFVVQKHDATRLHYDLRLEAGGVLLSWAVPKGPSMSPRDKRLAVRTEDHPLDYAGFEGIIPEHEYGGGRVIVWDRGEYFNLTERDGEPVSMEDGVTAGHIKFRLLGEKLRGAFALTRTGPGKNWILVKMKDEEATMEDILPAQPRSVLSGRSLEDLR